jgi:hypothetical protein
MLDGRKYITKPKPIKCRNKAGKRCVIKSSSITIA